VLDRRSHRRAVLVCLVHHGPLSAPWIAARWLAWISPESIRESLVWLERSGLAARTRQEERTPRGCWAVRWQATAEGRELVETLQLTTETQRARRKGRR